MQRADKHEFVKDLNSVLKKTEFVMVAHYKGLTVSEISPLLSITSTLEEAVR